MTNPAPALAVVHLPRSLVALFPGAPRRIEVTGATVAEVIDALDAVVPGLRNRVLDAGPSIRDHINVYVAAERASLDTEVPPGAAVHIIPAVSGGSAQRPRSPGPLTVMLPLSTTPKAP
jgi:molybdopterin synthase sulfur carrier subunit